MRLPSDRAPTKARELAREIRRMIVTGGFRPGDPLPSEAALIADYGLARATVREAIRIMAAEGLITVRIGRRGGIEVAEPDHLRVADAIATRLAFLSATLGTLMEFRRLVEPEVAALAAERATAAHLKRMESTLAAPSLAAALELHVDIADSCGNELLELLVRAVHSGMVPSAGSLRVRGPDAEAIRRRLRRIHNAVAQGDTVQAAEQMRRHIEQIERTLARLGLLDRIVVPSNGRRHETKADLLAGDLRDQILRDGLRPGDRLPSEADLIEQHSLSRATVREAIRILAAEGLVEARVGRTGGIHVGEPDAARVGDLLASNLVLQAATIGALIEFRRVVEPIAAALAAERATASDLERLRTAATAPSPEEELDFHLHIADACGNELLGQLLRAVHTGLREHRLYHEGARPDDAQAGTRTHRRLYEAVAAHDADRARALMRKHLEAVEVVVRRAGRSEEILRPLV